MLVAFESVGAILVTQGVLTDLLATASAGGELAFLASVLVYLRVRAGMSGSEILDRLGLSGRHLSARVLGIGIGIFIIILVLELAVNLASVATGTQINTNTGILLAGAPLWLYVFSIVITPVCEEVLFRAFMVPRIGILISAVLFGLAHASYDSTFAIEVIAAIVFALLAGYSFRKTESLYPAIIAHALVNLLAILPYVL